MSASRPRAVPTGSACRRGHRSAACGSRRTCRGDRRADAQRGRSAAGQSISATLPRLPARSRTARITSPGARPTRAVASRFDRDLQLRQPGELLGTQVGDTIDTAHQALGLLRQAGKLLEIRTEDAHGKVGRCPASPSSIRIPSGVVNSTAMPGSPFSCSRMSSSISSRSRRALCFQDHENVGHRVRHRIFGALGPSRSPHDVLDLGNPAQDVFHAVIQTVDFVERGL